MVPENDISKLAHNQSSASCKKLESHIHPPPPFFLLHNFVCIGLYSVACFEHLAETQLEKLSIPYLSEMFVGFSKSEI